MTIPMTSMQIMLSVILAVSGYLSIIQLLNSVSNSSRYSARYTWLIDIIVLVLYTLICYTISVVYAFTGYDITVIYLFLVLGVAVMLFMFVKYCFKNKDTMNDKNVGLFSLYFLALLYLTVFMRIGENYTTVKSVPFDDLKMVIENNDLSLAKHMFENILLFIPFGYLIPAMNPKKLRKWSFALLGGLVVSTLIEGIQMAKSLGECDIDDIIANTIGSALGYLAVRFVWRVRKNWKI